jgi:hypothetical protein
LISVEGRIRDKYGELDYETSCLGIPFGQATSESIFVDVTSGKSYDPDDRNVPLEIYQNPGYYVGRTYQAFKNGVVTHIASYSSRPALWYSRTSNDRVNCDSHEPAPLPSYNELSGCVSRQLEDRITDVGGRIPGYPVGASVELCKSSCMDRGGGVIQEAQEEVEAIIYSEQCLPFAAEELFFYFRGEIIASFLFS